MWLFKRKRIRYEYTYIPEEHAERFCELYDKFRKTGRHADKFRLWRFIDIVLPNRLDGGSICFPYATKPALRHEIVE